MKNKKINFFKKIIVELHWIAGYRGLKIIPALMPFCRTVGRSITKKSRSDRWYEAMAEWGTLSMGFL